MSGDGYTRAELLAAGEGPPEKGALCPRCGCRIPEFQDLTAEEEASLKELLAAGRIAEAMSRLQAATGCPLSWARIWAQHPGGPAPPRPETSGGRCPFCEAALRTPHARQCRECGMDWHDPDRPRTLRPISGEGRWR
jgi:hypothetical protein